MTSFLITGGSVWTGSGSPEKLDILVEEDRIAALGTAEEIAAHPGAPGATRLELSGESVVPGLTDTHVHIMTCARQKSALPLDDAGSLEEMLEKIREYGKKLAPEEWIYGVRFDNTPWKDNRLPNKEDLDALNLPNPILLRRVCVHVHVANSEGLRRAGISPEGNGILLENACTPLLEAMHANPAFQEREREYLEEVFQEFSSYGLTGVHTCGLISLGMPESMELFQKLEGEGALPLRIVSFTDQFREDHIPSGSGTSWVRYGGYKMILDGSFGGRTAALSRPYAGTEDALGILNYTEDHVRQQITEANRRNVQCQVHAIGDATLDQFLNALEASPGSCSLPHRAVHVQICRDDQIERMIKLGVACDIQPVFLPSDIALVESHLDEERRPWGYRWKDLLNAGLLLGGSSDTPVESPNPWRGIWAAVNRTNDAGYPEGGQNPGQKLSLEESLTLFTVNPPKLIGQEHELGRIEPGYKADLVLLDRDVFKEAPEKLKEVRPRDTMVDGKIRYSKK